MSDEPSNSPTEKPVRTPAGIFEHWCEYPGCKNWGCFGEPSGKGTRWHCGEHQDQD
jgi:hypothetical protein